MCCQIAIDTVQLLLASGLDRYSHGQVFSIAAFRCADSVVLYVTDMPGDQLYCKVAKFLFVETHDLDRKRTGKLQQRIGHLFEPEFHAVAGTLPKRAAWIVLQGPQRFADQFRSIQADLQLGEWLAFGYGSEQYGRHIQY
jgi:hypothetical protein